MRNELDTLILQQLRTEQTQTQLISDTSFTARSKQAIFTEEYADYLNMACEYYNLPLRQARHLPKKA